MSDPILANLFETNLYAIKANTEGVSDADALIQPSPAGNCMTWVIGHIASSRDGLLKVLGEAPVLSPDVAERFKRGSAPVKGPGDGPPLSTLLSDLAASQERLLRGIDKAPESKWGETHANFGTIRKAFYFLHFHEAYHAGQLALLRRLAGKKGAIP